MKSNKLQKLKARTSNALSKCESAHEACLRKIESGTTSTVFYDRWKVALRRFGNLNHAYAQAYKTDQIIRGIMRVHFGNFR